jgi:hypothetical protein
MMEWDGMELLLSRAAFELYTSRSPGAGAQLAQLCCVPGTGQQYQQPLLSSAKVKQPVWPTRVLLQPGLAHLWQLYM